MLHGERGLSTFNCVVIRHLPPAASLLAELILGYPPNRGLPPAGYPSNQLRPGGLPLQPGYPPVGYPSTRGRRTGYPCTAPTRVTPTDGLPPQGWVTPIYRAESK